MQVKIFSNFSKKQNSTKQPTGGTTYDVVFKGPCSTSNPVFLIDGIDLTATYLQWNNRYYFIDSIVLQNNNIYEIDCSIDTLATWKTTIGASSQYVLRSASASDGTIVDMFYPAKKVPTVVSKPVSTVSAPGWSSTMDGGCFVVGIVGTEYDPLHDAGFKQGGVTYYAFDPLNFQGFTSNLFTDSNWTDFTSADRYSFNPLQYISSVMWFPFWPSVAGNKTHVNVGWQSIFAVCKAITAPVSTGNYSITCDAHPQAASRGAYLSAAPYSEYCLSFPPFGEITLDPDVAGQGKQINIILKVDFISGKAMLIGRGLLPGNGMYEYFRREVQLGVNIQLAQIAVNRLGVAQNIVGGLGGAIGSAIAGDVVGTITSVASGVTSALQTAQPHVQTTGSNDSLIAVLGFGVSPFIYERYYQIVNEDNTNHGRPLCQVKTINTLSGYIMCANAEIDIPALPQERDMIMNYMNTGFFYE